MPGWPRRCRTRWAPRARPSARFLARDLRARQPRRRPRSLDAATALRGQGRHHLPQALGGPAAGHRPAVDAAARWRRPAGRQPERSLTLFDPLLSAVILLAWIGVVGLWWLYQYVDWANDIYQVTPTQIVDITRKPLGTESREVAPLENILGTEVDRKGLAGLLLNYGTVTATIGTAEFKFQGVFDPVGVQQDIVRAQEAILARKREKESGQRRDEMVELLRLYEKEIASRRAAPEADEQTDGHT